MTQDFSVGDTVELLNEGKPTGILGTVVHSADGSVWAKFPFNRTNGITHCNPDHLRRVEPEFLVQAGDLLEFKNGGFTILYLAGGNDPGQPPKPSVARVWRKTSDTEMRVVWSRDDE